MRFRFVVGLVCVLSGCGGDDSVVLEGEKMGMFWRVQVVGGEARVVRGEVERVFDRWERAASLWREDSEVSEFNRKPAGQWVKVGKELWAAVALARDIADETDGALDITVGPLVDLWGFGRVPQRGKVPSDDRLKDTRLRCGWRYLELDEAGHALRKLREDVEVNVNCVVEGLALEDLAGSLGQLGHGDFLLELGGELLARGRSATGGVWMVAVQAPGRAAGESFSMMPLDGGALATSGTYRQRFVNGGNEFSHVIDPRDGRPVSHRLTSVSVVDGHCGRADGFATALLVLGPEKGRVVAARLGLRVIWIEEVD